jgi:hypothetical protein
MHRVELAGLAAGDGQQAPLVACAHVPAAVQQHHVAQLKQTQRQRLAAVGSERLERTGQQCGATHLR